MTQVSDTLAERDARYGDFTDQADLAQKLQDVMRAASGWERCSSDKRQALTVIADKIARILSGDPEYRDNWHDLQGYAKLAEDRCVDTSGPQLPLAPDDTEGWIEWTGGERPESYKTKVTVRLRDGTVSTSPINAESFRWIHLPGENPNDIVAYKVVK